MTTSTSTAGSTTPSRSDPQAAPEPEGPAPSPELLEFLGEFSDERGAWIDPIELDDGEPEPEERAR